MREHDMQPVYEAEESIPDQPGDARLHICSNCGFRWVMTFEKVFCPPIPENFPKESQWVLDCDMYKTADLIEQ